MTARSKAEKIFVDQVRRLSEQAAIGIIATIINSLIIAALLIMVVPKLKVVIWLSMVLLFSVVRFIIQHRIDQGELSFENVKGRRKYILTALGLSACLWGSTSVFLFPHSSFVHQVLLILVLGGMVAGSVGVYSSIMAAFYCFSIPTVWPIVIRFIATGNGLHYGIAAMTALFWVLMLATAKRLNREIYSYLNLKYENVDLINDLEKEVQDRRAAQEQLQAKNQQIESIVADRTTELLHVNKKLREEIDDRIEAEKALRESKKKFVEFANFLPQVVFETDLNGYMTFVNRNAMHFFGTHDEPQSVNAFEVIAPDDRELARNNFMAILRGEPRETVEYTAIRKDGSTFPIVIHASLVVRDGKPAGVRGIIIDLTEEKKSQEDQRQLEAQLQRAQKMEILGTMAGGVAHDLNNILSGIVSYPDLMLMKLPAESPLRGPIKTMRDSGKKAAAIVQDLLTLTRRGVVSPEVLNLNDVINEYLQSPEHRKMLTFHPGTRVDVALEDDLLDIMGSHHHLAKTLMNLVSNAAEAMPDSGVISISTVNCYLDQPLRGYDAIQNGDYAVLCVSDTGIGIAPDEIERIFEPFFTKKVMGRSGTGLGMAVVWGTVKDHKGYIDVDSSEGRGATFSLYFPVTREKAAFSDVPDTTMSLGGEGQRVLVVDDVKEQRQIASDMLRTLGYEVSAVASGEAAIAYLADNRVDLILLDMIMDPGMDGLDTYTRIVERYGRQKAVIASGYSETDRVKAARRLGAGPCLKKPYTLKELGRVLHTVLHSS